MIGRMMHLGLAIIVAGMFAASAAAATVTAKFTDVSPSKTFKYTYNGSAAHVYAGQINWLQTAGDYDMGPGDTFYSYCIELTQQINPGTTYTFSVVDLTAASNPAITDEKATLLGKLWGQSHHEVGSSANHAAAFQIAIWEILSDSPLSLTGGSFKATDPNAQPAQIAKGWLETVGSYSGLMPTLKALHSSTAQDQIFFVPPTPETAVVVPLPAAVWAGGALIALITARKSLRKRQ